MATTGKSSQDLLQSLIDAHGAEADEADRWRNHIAREVGRGVQRLDSIESEIRRFRSTFTWLFVFTPFLIALFAIIGRVIFGG
jgi:hypothetical protein